MGNQSIESYKMHIVDDITAWAENIVEDIDAKAYSDAIQAVNNSTDVDIFNTKVLDDIVPTNCPTELFDIFFDAYQDLCEAYYNFYSTHGT